MSDLVGRQLGDYTLVGVLAAGGMARIYEAVDRRLGRQVAVKVLEANPDNHYDDDAMPMRFQREARAVAQLEHDNIITIYQYGEQDGLYFIAMKLVRGRDLAQEWARLRRSGSLMDVRRGLRILEQVASALDYAHAAQIIHRDVKPSNILIDANDRATLTDFGLVMQRTLDTTLGTAFGTPRYIAPEQALNSGSAVPQSDIYALGVILYELLTGRTPFDGETALEIALNQINAPVPPPRSLNQSIPLEAESALLRALAKDPTKRPESAGELVAAVKRAYEPAADASTELPIKTTLMPESALPKPKPKRRLPIIAIVAAAASLVLIVALIVFASGNNPPAEPPRLPTDPAPTAAAQVVALISTSETSTSETSEAEATAESTAPTTAALADPPDTPAAPSILLSYTDTTFSLINLGASDLDVRGLQFGQGETVFAGSSIPRGVVPAGTCFRIELQRTQSALPAECGRLYTSTVMATAARFFWRSETANSPTFAVRDGAHLIATCATVARGEAATCPLALFSPA